MRISPLLFTIEAQKLCRYSSLKAFCGCCLSKYYPVGFVSKGLFASSALCGKHHNADGEKEGVVVKGVFEGVEVVVYPLLGKAIGKTHFRKIFVLDP